MGTDYDNAAVKAEYEAFRDQAERDNRRSDYLIRLAFEWMREARLCGVANQKLVAQLDTAFALNDFCLDLLKQDGRLDRLTPEALQQLGAQRRQERQSGIATIQASMAEHARLSVNQRQAKAASHPRSKNGVRAAVMGLMRPCRANGQTLLEFIASAIAGSVEGLAVTCEVRHGVTRYTLDPDALDDSKTVALSTLKDWWIKAELTG